MLYYVFTFFVIILHLSTCIEGQSQSVKVKGPDYSVFVGDSENFTCTVQNEAPGDYRISWYFKYKSGVIDSIPSSDITDDYRFPNPQSRFSYIKVISADIDSIICIAYSNNIHEAMQDELKIKITRHQLVKKFSTLCDETRDRPTIIMQRFSDDPSSNYYWAPHDVTNSEVKITNPVTSFTLKCLSQTGPLNWTVTKSPYWRLSKSKYRNSFMNNECHEAILEIGPVSVNSTQRYSCRSQNNKDYQSFVDMDATAVTAFRGNFTPIEQCLLLLLNDNGGNGGLTGLSVTSSMASLFMFFGIVYFKRQLNVQKDKLKDIVEQQPT